MVEVFAGQLLTVDSQLVMVRVSVVKIVPTGAGAEVVFSMGEFSIEDEASGAGDG